MSDPSSSSGSAPHPSDRPKRPGPFSRLKNLFRKKDPSLDIDPMDVLKERASSGETLDVGQREMIIAAASFDKVRVSDVMVPRADIIGVEYDTPLGEVARLFGVHQHSRLPIYREVLDHPIGFIHVKDVLAQLTPSEDGSVPGDINAPILHQIKRDLLFVPGSLQLPKLLRQMRAARCHMALVIDEYGGTDGLVTVEDLIEEIIGDIDDEYDDEEAALLTPAGEGLYDADARIELEELTEKLGVDFMLSDMEDEIDTLGGLVAAMAGRLPARGQIFSHTNGYEIEVKDVDTRRIKKLLLRISATGTAADKEKDDKSKCPPKNGAPKNIVSKSGKNGIHP